MTATMETEFRQAVPTEYKGVVFRSKCEAIFCRALELRGFATLMEYEPKNWETEDGWTPDFWILSGRNGKVRSALIEYKPDSVTDT